MKKRFLMFLVIFPALSYGQTQTRNDAGIQGNAGATSGFFETNSPVNYPAGAFSWWHLLDVRHSYPENNFAMQFAGSFYDQNLYFRKTVNSPTQSWSKVLLETGGKVGIGTDTPNQKLTVMGGIGFEHNSSDKKLYSPIDGTLEWMTHEAAYKPGFAISHQGQQRVYLSINGDSYLNGGKVGIGTTAPQELLELKSSTPVQSFHMPGVASYKLGINSNGKFKIAGMDNSFGGHAGSFEGSNVQLLVMDRNGNVSIGTESTPEKLSVKGKIRAHEIKVEMANWPDYVFEHDYKILGLNELDAYIKANKHLPEMPSAKEAEANGIALGELVKLQQKKIEELTLHLIEKDKQIVKETEVNVLQGNKISAMQKEFLQLKQLILKTKKKK
ncbi:hypothetical protein [Pedobacter sp. Leaf176]|uniref:hypothetical protein n=1 Tax=Pedobacter sp. Leaf176 TaxID=1736286 RepID=UPI0006F3F0C6|nr:hypothetical protein [Pedobacter sp. Leaf176]KQR70903.1 hypothetical protein ASF92_05710 [Pedobacter sp. Leaf176]